MKPILIIVATILGAALVYTFALQPTGPAVVPPTDSAGVPTVTNVDPPALEQQAAGDDPPIKYSPEVFQPVSELVAKRLDPWVTDVYFNNKFHKGYVRHDIVEVDVNRLTLLVNEQTNVLTSPNAEEGYGLKKIQLPIDIVVANDKTISVVFDTVSVAMPGKFGISGHTMGNPNDTQTQLTIDHTSGRIISGHVYDGSKMHSIVSTPKIPYYLVTEAVPQPTLADDEIIRNGN